MVLIFALPCFNRVDTGDKNIIERVSKREGKTQAATVKDVIGKENAVTELGAFEFHKHWINKEAA